MDWMPSAVRDGILTVLFVSGPVVLLAAGLGLIVGIVQAATQVQEQTLGSAVKILGVFLSLILGGFWMFTYLRKYTTMTFNRAFRLVPSLETHPMPPKPFLSQKKGDDNVLLPSLNEENLPYEYKPPGGNEIPLGTGSRASVMSDIAEEPDITPVNTGSSRVITGTRAVPERETNPEGIREQGGLQPITELAPEEPAPKFTPDPSQELTLPSAGLEPVLQEQTLGDEAFFTSEPAPAPAAAPAPARQAQTQAVAPAPAPARTEAPAAPVRTQAPAQRPAPARTQAPVQTTPAAAPVRQAPARPAPVAVAPEPEPVQAAPRRRPGLRRSSVGNITDRMQRNFEANPIEE